MHMLAHVALLISFEWADCGARLPDGAVAHHAGHRAARRGVPGALRQRAVVDLRAAQPAHAALGAVAAAARPRHSVPDHAARHGHPRRRTGARRQHVLRLDPADCSGIRRRGSACCRPSRCSWSGRTAASACISGCAPRRWYRDWVVAFRAFAILLPTLALAGFVAAGNQTLREATSIRTTCARRATTPMRRAESVALVYGGAKIAMFAHIGLVGPGVRRARAARLALSPPRAADPHPCQRPPLTILPGATVLETLRDNGIPHASVCGGRARCTTCRVHGDAGLRRAARAGAAGGSPRSTRIKASPGTRLACQIRPTERHFHHAAVRRRRRRGRRHGARRARRQRAADHRGVRRPARLHHASARRSCPTTCSTCSISSSTR